MTRWQQIKEGKVNIRVPVEKVVSRDMPIFYNPVMALNRTLSIAVLRAWMTKGTTIADPLAGTGIRALRMLKELPTNKIDKMYVNDSNHLFLDKFRKTAIDNKVSLKKCIISNTDASKFLLETPGADYIEIDPFGSPNPFLDAACKRLGRHGLLAITATDTAPLAGTYPAACKRKYDAIPLRDSRMHETGIRILIRKVQLVAAQYDKALTPVFTYATNHYYRLFLACEKSKSAVDTILKQHDLWQRAGPLWTGQLWDAQFLTKLKINDPQGATLLETIRHESTISSVGFFDIHTYCKKLHCVVPKTEHVLKKLVSTGQPGEITHFCPTGIRTCAPEKTFVKILRELTRAKTLTKTRLSP